jgi:hypothetical protein
MLQQVLKKKEKYGKTIVERQIKLEKLFLIGQDPLLGLKTQMKLMRTTSRIFSSKERLKNLQS